MRREFFGDPFAAILVLDPTSRGALEIVSMKRGKGRIAGGLLDICCPDL
jgi:hypothetical protein